MPPITLKNSQTLYKPSFPLNLSSAALSLSLVALSTIAGCTSSESPNSAPNSSSPNSNPSAASSAAPSAAAAAPATGGSSSAKLTLVSYAVTRSAYEKIVPAFIEDWKKKTGQTVTIEQSYGGSGSQTRAVIDGLEADVVALALALDTGKIEKAGLIKPGWETELPHDAIVTRSVAALVLRDPSVQVKGWSDLVNDKIQVITANPKTSGGARWNFLALWGSETQAGKSEADAKAFVDKVFKNTPVLPKDAREASDVFFKQGQGNVLINYENEVLLAKNQGQNLPFVVPTDYNISIDSPVAVVDTNVDKHGTRKVAEAFAQYLFTPDAQKIFAEAGFRPVDETVAKEFSAKYPTIQHLFTVKDLGGWKTIQEKFFADGAEFDQMQSRIGKSF